MTPEPIHRTHAQIVAHILAGATSSHIVVTPLAWQPSDGTGARRWYFSICTGRGADIRIDQITVDGPADSAIEDRTDIILALACQPALVIHDMGSELKAARLIECIWPCERTTNLRRKVEAENQRALNDETGP